MAQPDQAAGGDTVVAAEPTLADRFAAIADIPQEEDPDKKPQDVEGDPQGDPPTDGEQELTPEDVPDEEAAPEAPPIPPPVSWTTEEKEKFAELPRDIQETLTRREAERDKFVQTKAEEAKAARGEVEQQAYALMKQTNEAHVQHLLALLPQIPDEPSHYLQRSDPDQYAYQAESRRIALAQHAHAQQVIEAVANQQQQIAAAQEAEARKVYSETLSDKFPEWLDPAKGPELQKALTSTALALGYPSSDLPKADARDILAIKQAHEWHADAMKYRALMETKMETVRSAKTLPRVSRPGVPAGKGTMENQRYAEDRQAMQRGDKNATNRVFAKFL